jgi:hypothetical protein
LLCQFVKGKMATFGIEARRIAGFRAADEIV